MICFGDSLQLDATSPQATYLWLDDSAAQPLKTVKAPGTYTVRITNQCGTSEASREVAYKDCEVCTLYAPTAFTPNGDGLDDTFRTFPSCPAKEFHLSVYNRWGQRIFESDDIERGWDGAKAPEGVYLYIIRLRDQKKKETFRSGTVTLVR